MPVETTYLPTNPPRDHIGAAGFLAIIAYPDEKDWNKRDDVILHARAAIVKPVARRSGHLRDVSPELSEIRPARLEAKFNSLNRRIVDKRQRAYPALWIQLFQRGQGLKSNQTLNQFAEARQEGSANFYNRVWTPTKPVAHLLFGLQTAMFDWTKKHPELDRHVWNLIQEPSWLISAIENSEKFRKTSRRTFGINPKEMIQVLPE